jgi:capsid protein
MSSYSVTGDLSDANYSSLREGKLSEWRRVKIMRNQLANDFCAPVFRRWMEAAVQSRFLRLPDDFECNQHFYCNAKWYGSPMPWVDPLKDINALKTEIEIGLKTQTEILAERGIDFTDWCEIKAQEMAIAERYGIQLAPVEDSPALTPDDFDDDDEPIKKLPPSDGDRLLDSPTKRVPRKQKKRQKWR